MEIAGESANALIPYNVNTQNTRTRYWDGKDNLFKDDVTIIKGNHLIQVGGSYQRNYNEHSRTDNGQGINNSLTYQVTSSNINFGNFAYPTGMPTSQAEQLQHLLLLRDWAWSASRSWSTRAPARTWRSDRSAPAPWPAAWFPTTTPTSPIPGTSSRA